MRRVLVAVFLAVLAPAPAAAAKGPHAVISPGPAGIAPGRPWVATLTLYEYRRSDAAAARPTMIVRSGDTRSTVRPSHLRGNAPRYRLRVVFPRPGRWSYTVVDGTPAGRRFWFPPVLVGDGLRRVTRDVGASPTDGPWVKRIVFCGSDEEDGGGARALWILAGLPLAAAGTLAVRERRRRHA